MGPDRVFGLRQSLAAFRPGDARQTEAKRQMEQLLGAGEEQAFHRSFLDPGHFTASGFILGGDGQSLLLIFHKKLQRWLQPGGHFELSDGDHVAAARREVAEEVGLEDVELVLPLYDLDVHVIPASSKEAQHLHFDLRVLFRSPTLDVHATDEVESARYFSLAELTSARGAHSDDSVERVARQLLRV